jgi:hypothetical protein
MNDAVAATLGRAIAPTAADEQRGRGRRIAGRAERAVAETHAAGMGPYGWWEAVLEVHPRYAAWTARLGRRAVEQCGLVSISEPDGAARRVAIVTMAAALLTPGIVDTRATLVAAHVTPPHQLLIADCPKTHKGQTPMFQAGVLATASMTADDAVAVYRRLPAGTGLVVHVDSADVDATTACLMLMVMAGAQRRVARYVVWSPPASFGGSAAFESWPAHDRVALALPPLHDDAEAPQQ